MEEHPAFVDRSQHTLTPLDELRQIRLDTRQTTSLDRLKKHFERLQLIRRVHVDDFELQVMVADVHQEIIERARYLREEAPVPATGRDEASRLFPREQVALFTEKPLAKTLPAKADSTPGADEPSDAAEIPPEVPRLDSKSWQLAVGLALFLTVLVLAAFFYLIQTARKLNFKDQQPATAAAPQAGGKPSAETVGLPAAVAAPPTLRLYTDLLPATVTFDGQPPRNLSDGEFVLDNLQPGRHSISVAGKSGLAAFDFEVTGKGAPQVIGTPTASNAMAVLVSQEDGRGRLVTNAQHSTILLDGKPAGEVGAQGLALEALGKTEHDLQVTQDRDHQRFVLTYTPAPALTVYVKSDPNVGTVVVMAGQDEADVYIDDVLYRRKTEHGQLRIPLKAGKHNIRVHKAGFMDPPPMVVEIKKSEETPAMFTLKTAPEVLRAAASVGTVVTPEQTAADKKEPAPPPPAETPAPAPVPAAPATHLAASDGLPVDGEQVRRGGGFVSYHVPRTPGRYSFEARGRVGGFLKHGKLQWYAGYQDSENYILFTLDGKHANIREVRGGKSIEWNRVPFAADSNDWVQVDLAVKANSISARVKNTNGAWTDIGDVNSPGRDFTQDKVGFYIPTNDEVAIANFRFSNR
jgi:hypothetical protein